MNRLPIDEYYKNQNCLNGILVQKKKSFVGLDVPIYKYISLENLLKWLEQSKLFLGKIDSWSDKYEGFLFKYKYFDHKGELINFGVWTKSIYAQSWTYQKESDAMWRLYTGEYEKNASSLCELKNVAIKVSTTPRKLFDTVYVDNFCMDKTYIGNVLYMEKVEIEKYAEDFYHKLVAYQQKGGTEKTITDSIFIKRHPYNYEKEARVVVWNYNNVEDFISYEINDWNKFISEITLNPYLEKEQSYIVRKELEKYVDAKKIKQSSLYNFKELTFK